MRVVRLAIQAIVYSGFITAMLLSGGNECECGGLRVDADIPERLTADGLPDEEWGSIDYALSLVQTSSDENCEYTATVDEFNVDIPPEFADRLRDDGVHDGLRRLLYRGANLDATIFVSEFEGGWTIPVEIGAYAAPADAGLPDAGLVDAGAPDAGIVDAGAPDAGIVDAGAPDAGIVDAGAPDAGIVDAGNPDAGIVDAGNPDAGIVDAGNPVASRAVYEVFDGVAPFDVVGQVVTFHADGEMLFSSGPQADFADTPGAGTMSSTALMNVSTTMATALPLGRSFPFLGVDVDTLQLDPYGLLSDVGTAKALPVFPTEEDAFFVDDVGTPRRAVAFFYSDVSIVFGTVTFDVFDDRWVLSIEDAFLGELEPIDVQVRGFFATGDIEVNVTAGGLVGPTLLGVSDVAADGVAPAPSDLVVSVGPG